MSVIKGIANPLLIDTSEFTSVPMKQWFQIDVSNEIVMHFMLSLIPSLIYNALFVPIEANSGSVYSSTLFVLVN